MGRFARRGLLQRFAVQAVFLQKVVQGDPTDANVPSRLNEIEYVIARGIRMRGQEVSHRSGVAWQKFSVGPASESLLNFPDDIPGREPLLS
jgi:hypothetical protein